MIDMQNYINEVSKGWRVQRSLSQMTLGEFISELESLPENKTVENICQPHSYRGYYSDLAFEKHEGTRTVGSLLTELKNACLNKTFEGYKGGEFYMDKNTPIWIAEYGRCGVKMMELSKDDVIIFSTQEDD